MTERRYTPSFLEDYTETLKRALAFVGGCIKSNLIVFISIILLATAAGAAYWYSEAPYYESDVVCTYNNERFSKKTFGEMVQKLSLLAKSRSANELSRVLQLPVALTSKIVAIEARNWAGNPLHEDITGDHQSLYINLKTTDRRVFAPYQEALVNYLSSTPYQLKIGSLQVAKFDRQIAFLRPDLLKTDSVIDAYTAAIRAGLVFRDTVANHSDITDILNYKKELEENIASLEWRRSMESGPSITVMHGFAPADRPSRSSRKVIAGFALLGLLAAVSLAIIRGPKRRVNA